MTTFCPCCQMVWICQSCSPVSIYGLQKRPEFNGEACKLLGKMSSPGRWAVEVGSGVQLSVKPANLKCQHPLVISPHLKKAAACVPAYGFQRIEAWKNSNAFEPPPDYFRNFACIHFMGYGRWDAKQSKVDGLSTYALKACCAFLITDSLTAPSRFVLIHASFRTFWEQRVATEVRWVAETSSSPPFVLLIKGGHYLPHPKAPSEVEAELFYQLSDNACVRLREALDATGLSDTPLFVQHAPLPSTNPQDGAAFAFGRNGAQLPLVPLQLPHGFMGLEPSSVEIAARHSAYFTWEAERTEGMTGEQCDQYPGSAPVDPAVRKMREADLDLQYDITRRVPPSLPEVVKHFEHFRKLPLAMIPYYLVRYAGEDDASLVADMLQKMRART